MSATLRLELPRSILPQLGSRLPRLPRLPWVSLGILLAAGAAWAQLPTPEPHRAPESLAIGKYDVSTHAAQITANASYTVNAENSVTVKLVAKSGYHINPKYPIKLTATPVEGVAYPKSVLTRADGKFSDSNGEIKLPFVPTKPGHAKVGGQLSFGVCNEKSCLVDRVDLAVEISAK